MHKWCGALPTKNKKTHILSFMWYTTVIHFCVGRNSRCRPTSKRDTKCWSNRQHIWIEGMGDVSGGDPSTDPFFSFNCVQKNYGVTQQVRQHLWRTWIDESRDPSSDIEGSRPEMSSPWCTVLCCFLIRRSGRKSCAGLCCWGQGLGTCSLSRTQGGGTAVPSQHRSQ